MATWPSRQFASVETSKYAANGKNIANVTNHLGDEVLKVFTVA